MKKYIEAVKIAEIISEKLNVPLGELVDIFAEIPTADVVEVVRCKDCKHNYKNGGDCDRVLIHTRRNLVLEKNEYLYYKLNHCEYGERGDT